MDVFGLSYGTFLRRVKRGPQLVHVVNGYEWRLPGESISLRQSSHMQLSVGMDAPFPPSPEPMMENPFDPMYSPSILSMESIFASGGSSLRRTSRIPSTSSLSIMTLEPSLQTVPEAPAFTAARYTAGLNPTP